MQINITKGSGNSFVALDIVHRKEVLEWNVDTYKRSKTNDIQTVFSNINGYLKSLSEERQTEIFEVYRQIHEKLDSIHDSLALHLALQKKVKQLFSKVDFAELKKWVRMNGQVGAPEDLKEEYGEVELRNDLTRRLTYLRDDYYDLAIFSTLMKLAVPIFGEYIRRTAKEVSTKFKEHYAFSLLSKSNIIDTPAFKRLRDYVEAKALNEERKKPSEYRKNSAVLKGLGTEELPDWLLSRAIVRRVAIHEEAIGGNIVANVYCTIDQQFNGLDKTFNGRISEKRLYGNGNEEENVSVAENYKVKQEISDGDLAVLSIHTEQMYDMAAHVDPTCDLDKVRICSNSTDRNSQLQIQQHHITLTQWVVSKAISPRGIPSLNKPALLKAMAVTQGLLWHWGFEELALLMTCEPVGGASIAATTPTTRLDKRYVERFAELYPFYQPVSKSAHNIRNVNVACKAIDLLSHQLGQTDWSPNGPVELEQKFGVNDVDHHVVSAEIRFMLADLILKLQEVKHTRLS